MQQFAPGQDDPQIEIEQIALGTILEDAKWLTIWQLVATDFREPLHREMFALLQQRYSEGEDTSPAVIGHLLSQEPPAGENCPVPDYVRRLRIKSFEATPGLGKELRNSASLRMLLEISRDLKAYARDPQTDIASAVAAVSADLNDVLATSNTKDNEADFGEIAKRIVDRITDGTTEEMIDLGLLSLNQPLSGGLRRGDLTLLAGRPSMGKSLVGGSLGLKAARKGHATMVFSLEMTQVDISERMLSELTYIPGQEIEFSRIRSGDVSGNEHERLARAAAKLHALPLRINDRRGLTVADIMARASRQKEFLERKGQTLDLVIVDHLGCIRPSERYAGSKVNEVGEISEALKTLARQLDVAVLALHQLNRGVEQRDNKRPQLSDLRDCGNLEQDADNVVFVFRESYYLERISFDDPEKEAQRSARLATVRNQLELSIAKQRQGPTSTVHLFCEPACSVVSDLTRQTAQPGGEPTTKQVA